MASLEERLKRIRQSAITTAKPPTTNKVTAAPKELAQSNQDEVDDLIRQTRDQVAVERSHVGNLDESDDVEAWLAQDSGEEEVDEGGEVGTILDSKTVRSGY